MTLLSKVLDTAARGLDVRMQRHQVLAGNVANLDTPQFVPLDVDVDAAMAQPTPGMGPAHGMTKTHSHHFPDAGAALMPTPVTVSEVPAGGGSWDGNRVDVDRAMTSLAQNALQYGATAKGLTRQLALLRYAASDGSA
jgi:flagellar basal-body rod protein FlgB